MLLRIISRHIWGSGRWRCIKKCIHVDVEDLLEEVDVGDVLKERQVFEDIYNEVDFEDVRKWMLKIYLRKWCKPKASTGSRVKSFLTLSLERWGRGKEVEVNNCQHLKKNYFEKKIEKLFETFKLKLKLCWGEKLPPPSENFILKKKICLKKNGKIIW